MSNTTPETDPIEDVTPSAKAVFLALHLLSEREARITPRDLAETTRLAPRTVRHGLTQLKDQNLIDERPSLQDARQSWLWLTDDAPEAYPDR